MTTLRPILFWAHLASGLVAGVVIGIMCFTGTVLAFEHEIVEWAERDARRVIPPAEPARISLADLQRRLREAQPEFHVATVTLQNDPAAAVTFSAGREGGYYVNPYTGEVRQPTSTQVHDFMHTMTDWHRFLGREGEQRAYGKMVNGVCNLAFFALAATGLYLWWPRSWSRPGLKAVALFNWRLTGKARDFNWHNVIGLWSAAVLIVLTLTAVPISFRWGGNLIYRLVGEEPPVQQGPGAAPATPAVEVKRPSPEARPLGYDAVVSRVQQEFPRWTQITLRNGSPARASRPAAENVGGAPSPSAVVSAKAEPREASVTNVEPRREPGPGESRPAPQPLTIIVREAGSWPRTATTTLTLNPFTGEELKREGFADLTAGRQIRTWTRFLHTGQALGWGGQLVAGLACLGGCFLVFTGLALSWRRFFGRKPGLPPTRAD